MARPVTLFTGQWADLPLEVLAQKAKSWGYDGLELACWGDHFEVDKALKDDNYCKAKRALFEDEVVLPAEARRGLDDAAAARHLAEETATRALSSTVKAVHLLHDRLGLSVRDVGELLGLSHQRVQQLCRGER